MTSEKEMRKAFDEKEMRKAFEIHLHRRFPKANSDLFWVYGSPFLQQPTIGLPNEVLNEYKAFKAGVAFGKKNK